MRILCVLGGGYKSFYLNCFLKLKTCDLLIFNYGILYDLNHQLEENGTTYICKEITMLAKQLNAIVVGGIYVIKSGKRFKSLIVSDGDKVEIFPAKTGARINVENFSFIVGDECTCYGKYNKIILAEKRFFINEKHCSSKKIYLFCSPKNADLVVNKKIFKKFNKYSKFILK